LASEKRPEGCLESERPSISAAAALAAREGAGLGAPQEALGWGCQGEAAGAPAAGGGRSSQEYMAASTRSVGRAVRHLL
jgi:hypothetical protein